MKRKRARIAARLTEVRRRTVTTYFCKCGDVVPESLVYCGGCSEQWALDYGDSP